MENIEDEDELTSETLDILAKKHRACNVIEYNGMWQLKTLYDNMPEKTGQSTREFMFAGCDRRFPLGANMRGLVVDKLRLRVGRVQPLHEGYGQMAFHKIVRGIGRRPDIAYEYTNGDVEYDEIEDRCRLTSTRRS